jgi:hypothetical protein
MGAESAKRYRKKAGDRSETRSKGSIHAPSINPEKTEIENRKSKFPR